jgi:hypothetical protein
MEIRPVKPKPVMSVSSYKSQFSGVRYEYWFFNSMLACGYEVTSPGKAGKAVVGQQAKSVAGIGRIA